MTTTGASSIFLTVVVAIIFIVSVILSLALLLTSLKLRRLQHTDKSNYLLTHLILADFICAFCICIPSGYGVYNQNELDKDWCHVQTYFTSFFFIITFHGLLAIAIERYYKFFHTQRHEELFSTEAKEAIFPICRNVLIPIVLIWFLDIFFAFIPLFANINDLQYFKIQAQCDYIYEKFKWWLFIYFFLGITIPFIITVAIFTLIFIEINKKKNQIRRRKLDEQATIPKQSKMNKQFDKKHQDLFNIANVRKAYKDDDPRSAAMKKTSLQLFKYKNEREKTYTFFIITVLSYIFVFPVLVIHFYRSFNTNGSNYDSNDFIDWKVYTSFVWISYCCLFFKSGICFVVSKFYRGALRQALNMRGYRGNFKQENSDGN